MSLFVLAARRGAALALSPFSAATAPTIGRRLASRAQPRSPTKLDPRVLAGGLKAEVLHDANDRVLRHDVDERYVERALKTVPFLTALTHDLTRNMKLRTALQAVVTMEKAKDEEKKKEKGKGKVKNKKESSSYAPTAQAWNIVSREFASHRARQGVGDLASHAIVCLPTGHRQALGSYLGDTMKLDYTSCLAPLTHLNSLITAPEGEHTLPPLSSVLGPGEHKRFQGPSYSQLKSYLELVKRYRVDLSTVHGFQISGDQIVLASLNACGMWISPSLPISDIRAWIAHMALLYHAWDTRISELNYRSDQPEFARWDVSFGDRHRALLPFWASRPPGRSTFACLQIAKIPRLSDDLATMKRSFYDEDAVGFDKFSWQDVEGCSREAELLEHLHSPSYIAGVVRPTFTYQYGDSNAVRVHAGTSSIRRVMQIIELGSVGKPLSQARSPRHLLYAFYDLIATLRALSKKNVLHRDVSWYNILIDPVHTVDDGRGVEPHQCISHVMFTTGLDVTERPFGRRAGTTVFESCSLLADFDHAVDPSTSDEAVRREKTGTPMFISVERSRPSACRFNLPRDAVDLLAQLGEVERTDKGRKLFKAAFPAGDGGFMGWFESMIAAERVRRRQDLGSNGRINHDGKHEVRHDVESAWWTYLWAFARARPRGSVLEAQTSEEACSFNSFAGAMLKHAVDGTSSDWDRAKYLFTAANVDSLFHPRFHVFESLFRALGSYLSIPWHLYSGMPEDHIFTACQRIILTTIASDDAALDVELDTEQPRITTALKGIAASKGITGHTRSNIANVRPAFVAASIRQDVPTADGAVPLETVDMSVQCVDSPVQPASNGEAHAPVLAAHEERLEVAVSNVDDTSSATRRRRKRKQASDYKVYRHDVHLNLRTPHALRLTIWKDKDLWFQSGRRKMK